MAKKKSKKGRGKVGAGKCKSKATLRGGKVTVRSTCGLKKR